jgi:hypothetical protein
MADGILYLCCAGDIAGKRGLFEKFVAQMVTG